MSNKYRIKCTVHDWQYVWSDTEVTTCPVEESDQILPDSVAIIEKEVPVISLIPLLKKVNNVNYTRIASIIYDSNVYGILRRVRILTSADAGITSYDVEVYSKNTYTSLVTGNFSSSEDLAIHYIGPIENFPEGIVNLEINVKKNGGTCIEYVNISEISLLSSRG
jgi:hypothetical protein